MEHSEFGVEAEQRRDAGEAEHEGRQRPGEARPRRRHARQALDRLDRLAVFTPHLQDDEERAKRHRDIDRQIHQHRRDAFLRAGGEADQREADIVDRRIGEQPLDVALPDRRNRTEDDRGERGEDHHLAPLIDRRPHRFDRDPHRQAKRRHLGRAGEEGRHRRRRAFVHVRRPHVERHRRHLERQTGEYEHQAEHQPHRAACGILSGDVAEQRRAAEPVNQRNAIKQNAAGQRAEHEILQARFGRAGVAPHEARQHISRKALQLEPDIQAEQITRRHHDPHADRREQDQHGIFGAQIVARGALEEIGRHHDRDGGGDVDQHLGEGREGIDQQQAVERHALRDRKQREAGADQHRDRAPGDRPRRALPAPCGHQHQRQRTQ